MRKLGKKPGTLLLAAAMVLASLVFPAKAEAAESTVGLGVTSHTQAEIAAFASSHPASLEQSISYSTEPSLSGTYSAGVLSDETVNSAMNLLNQVRYIAGVGSGVTHDAASAKLASAASLLNYLNGKLDHYPTRPDVLSDSSYDQLYNDGALGAKSSNIHYSSGYLKLSINNAIINGWLADEDASNIPMVGHRRWLLSPALTSVGFGSTVSGSVEYSAVYVNHDFWGGNKDLYVAWPAQEMPVQYFDAIYPWSLQLNYKPEGNVSVSVVSKSDNTSWNFVEGGASDGDFYVNKEGYGSTAAVIFKPNGITTNAGDSYDVTVTLGDSATVKYTVNFFDLNSPEESTSGSDNGGNTDNGSTDTGSDSGNISGSDTDGSNNNEDSVSGSNDDKNGNGNDNGNDNSSGNGNNDDNDNSNGNGNDNGNSNNNGNNNGNSGAVSSVTRFTENVVSVNWAAVTDMVAAGLQSDDINIRASVGTKYTVPASLIDSFRNTDKVLMLHSGNGLSISIQGVNLKKEASDLNISLSFDSAIPSDVKDSLTSKSVFAQEFSMADKAELPFKVDVHVNLGAENAGKTAKLYYYDESRSMLRLAGTWTVTESGQAMFAITRGDEYIVVVDDGSAAEGTVSYTIAAGDCLSAIAKKNGVSLNNILQLNPWITNPNKIYPGRVIVLP